MQKIATRIFITASVAFGIIGVTMVLFGGPDDNSAQGEMFMRLIAACVFIILPSFALSVAAKYLDDHK